MIEDFLNDEEEAPKIVMIRGDMQIFVKGPKGEENLYTRAALELAEGFDPKVRDCDDYGAGESDNALEFCAVMVAALARSYARECMFIDDQTEMPLKDIVQLMVNDVSAHAEMQKVINGDTLYTSEDE